jgi:probable rRNA maturation factor
MSPDGRRLQVAVCDAQGRPIRALGLSSWLQSVAPPLARGGVSIALISDRHIRALNRRYRRKDRVTDVLSFPSAAKVDGLLGEIVIGRGVARRQAREARHSELTELRILALHGLLHLLGYDHESDRGEMRRVERRLRRKGGLSEGLIERRAPAAR